MPITNQSLGGRAYLVKKLMSGGFSRRKSVAVVSVILERMIEGLRRGEEVEFAGGKLHRVERHFSKSWDFVDDWPANRQPYTVEWVPSWEGLKRLLGPEDAEKNAPEFSSDEAFVKAFLAEMDPRWRRKKGGSGSRRTSRRDGKQPPRSGK